MNEEIAKIFNLLKKDKNIDQDRIFLGDDIHMKSVAPYGIPSGLPQLDVYLGCRGGLPASKVIEYYGAPMTGKTTAALQAAAEWQKRGGLVFFIDTEQSFTPRRAREVGVNPEDVVKTEPETIEEAFAHIISSIDSLNKAGFDKPVLFIVDSVTGVPTEADSEGNIDASDRPGFEAKQIKRGVRKVNPLLSQAICKPSIIFINHIISKIGMSFGKQTDSGGGKGIKFYASVRVEFNSLGQLKDGDRRIGQKVQVNIEKLKGGHLEYPRFPVELTNEHGFDKIKGLHEAMIVTNYADRPKNSKVTTILSGTDQEEQFKNTEILEWVETKGGYEKVYAAWRKWCINANILTPWGNGS